MPARLHDINEKESKLLKKIIAIQSELIRAQDELNKLMREKEKRAISKSVLHVVSKSLSK